MVELFGADILLRFFFPLVVFVWTFYMVFFPLVVFFLKSNLNYLLVPNLALPLN